MVKAWCLFDAFGTLIFPEPDAATVYHRIGQRHGDTRSAATIRALFDIAIADHVVRAERSSTDHSIEVERWRSVVRAVFADIADDPSLFVELWEHFSNPNHWRVFDDVADAFRQLQQIGVKLGIASNFDQRLRTISRGLAPLNQVREIFISSELGWRKPAPEFFQAIRDRLGVTPDRLWMIGDDFALDADPARKCGWHSVHVDRRQSEPILVLDDQIPRIRDLSQLVELLL